MNGYFELGMGILFLLIGGGLILWESLEVERALASRRWPRVPGKMIRLELEKVEGNEGTSYRYQVLCRYQVGDAELLCSRLRFGLKLSWLIPLIFARARLKRIAKRHVVAGQVAVAYNPEKPEESVLETGLDAGMIFELLFGAAFFVFGILLVRQQL